MATVRPTPPADLSSVPADKLTAGLRLSGRTERLIALARVLLATFALLAFLPSGLRSSWILPAFGGYVTYSVGFAGAVWSVKALPRWWSFATHAVDCTALSLLVSSPGHRAHVVAAAAYVFLIVCGTLRWQWRGAVGTAGAALILVAARPGLGGTATHVTPPVDWSSLSVVTASMAFVALVIGYMGAYHRRFAREVVFFAEWPNRCGHDERYIVGEILQRAALVLNAPSAVFVWTPPGPPDYQFARFTRSQQSMEWDLLADDIELHDEVPDYISDTAATSAPRFLARDDGHLREKPGLPLGDRLRERLRPTTLIGCLLEGQSWRGRLLIVDKPAPTLDDLLLTKIVARLGCATLDQHYLIEELQRSAADEERGVLARDLHDGFLQTLTALALQLDRLERVLESDAVPAAHKKIGEIQQMLSHEHDSFRTFIQQLKPAPLATDDRADLAARLRALCDRVREQWNLNLKLTVSPDVVRVPSHFAQQVHWLVREALVNAARHAMASQVAVEVVAAEQHLDIVIADDGRGFPFRGRRDAGDLAVMRAGPRSLRERIAALAGALLVDSRDDGATLRIRLPIPPGA